MKKPEPEPEEEKSSARHMAVGVFKTSLGWGVKDRAGEWIQSCIRKSEALALFEKDPTAFQLIEGCDPWACLDDSPVTLVVRRENPAALPPRPPEEY